MGVIGSMNRKVELKSLTSSKSSMGAPVKTYTHYKYVQASRKKASSTPENYVNTRLVVVPSYIYTMHSNPAVDETMKLIDDSIEYNILQVDHITDLLMEVFVEKIVE